MIPTLLIVDADIGNAYPVSSLRLIESCDPDTECKGMIDNELVSAHSIPEVEIQMDESSVMDYAVYKETQVFNIRHRDETDLPSLDSRDENRISLPPLCRVDIRIGDVPVNACIDS